MEQPKDNVDKDGAIKGDLSMAHIEAFMSMMGKHKIDRLKFGPIEIQKSQHDYGPEPMQARKTTEPTEDELYFSAQ